MTNQEKNIALSKWEGFDPWWRCDRHSKVSEDRILATPYGAACPWCKSSLELRECADYFEDAEPLRRLRKRLSKEEQESFLNYLFSSLGETERNADGILAMLNTPNDVQIEIIGGKILHLW